MKDASEQNTQRLGRIMMIMAWVLFLGLMGLFFKAWESKEKVSKKIQIVTKDGITETILTRNVNNQYITDGTINGHSVTLLLDTGANHVVVPGDLAAKLQLKRGMQGTASTAGGDVVIYLTKIDELSIGHIVLHNLTAMINPKMSGDEVLLGMSALKRITFTQENGKLTLTVPKGD